MLTQKAIKDAVRLRRRLVMKNQASVIQEEVKLGHVVVGTMCLLLSVF